MKKIFNILVLVFLTITSCSEDFLDRSPEDSLTSGNFYKTQRDFEQALVATYESMRWSFNDRHSWVHGEQRSDNVHLTYNSNNRPAYIVTAERSDQFLDQPSFADPTNKWQNLYVSISSANFIITRIDDVEMDQDIKNSILGEAKFIRALCYFNLVRYFGPVPLHLQPTENIDEAFLPRSPVEEVYNAIIADAIDAIQLLPTTSFPQTGRVTLSSARMLLGDVYLTLKQYSDALPHFEAITTAGHGLVDTPELLYELRSKNSIESIFELQYLKTEGLGQANNNTTDFLPMSSDLSLIVGFTPSSNDLNGGFSVPTDEMMADYETGDLRLEASVGIAEGTGVAPDNFVIESIQSPVGYNTPDGKTSYRYVKKYVHPHEVWGATDDNFPIYRYAETLLSLAETLNELGRSAEALPYLNEVRNRAGLPDVIVAGQSALRDIIIHEKRIELAYENKRYLDLVRTGTAIEKLTAYGIQIRAQFGDVGNYILPDGYMINQNKLLLPIPERAIRIGDIKQNPGY